MEMKRHAADKAPLVSVVIPVYNHAEFIVETLESVHDQTWRPLEVVVVDDGSTDGSPERVREWIESNGSNEDFRVRLDCQRNSGAPTARNRGFALSRGAFVLFLDSDDCLHSEKISRQIEAMQANPDWEFSYGPVAILEDPACVHYGSAKLTREQVATRQLAWAYFQTSGPLATRSLVERVGAFAPTLSCCQDWEFHTRLTLQARAFGWVPDALAYYRLGEPGRPRISMGRGNPRRELSRKRYLRARLVQLRSAWRFAPARLRSRRLYRAALVWQVLRILTTWRLAHGSDPGAWPTGKLACIARGTPVAPLLGLVAALRALRLPNTACSVFAITEWTYYRATGVCGRLRRLARPDR